MTYLLTDTKWKSICLAIFFVLFLFQRGNGQDLKRFEYSEPAMGTVIGVIFYATDSAVANKVAKAVFSEVARLNIVFSDYDKNSELSKLCDTYQVGMPIKISAELFEIFQQAEQISQLTHGRFDVTVGPFTKMWRRAKSENKLPSKQELSIAKSTVGYKNTCLNVNDTTIVFEKAGMQIDLGAIAKGYTADKVLKVLESNKIRHALVDFGGDIITSNPPPNKKGWNVEVSFKNHFGKRVSEILVVSNTAIATSGDLYQKLVIDGKTYSHIIDPSTGLGITKRTQVTVIAPSGALADGFASAFSVMSKKEVKKFIRKNKKIHTLISSLEEDSMEIWRSEFFDDFKEKE